MNIETEIIKIKGDWKEVVNDCRATVSKGELGKDPSKEFRKSIVISEHDPLRDIEIKFRWKNIPYWVAMHWKTHIWRSRTNTQRNDRQSAYDRRKAPQDALVDFIGDPNAQHCIDTWRKRLCFMAAPEETRAYAEDFKQELQLMEPEISNGLVPNCVYRCGCPEPGGCGWFDAMVKQYPKLASTNIQERYDEYNTVFYKDKLPF